MSLRGGRGRCLLPLPCQELEQSNQCVKPRSCQSGVFWRGSWLHWKDTEEWKVMSILLTWPAEGCCQWWQTCLMEARTENKKLLRVLLICLVDSHTWPSYLLWILSHSKTYGSSFKLYCRRKRKRRIITGVLTDKELWIVCVFPGLPDSCLFGVDAWIRWLLYLPW